MPWRAEAKPRRRPYPDDVEFWVGSTRYGFLLASDPRKPAKVQGVHLQPEAMSSGAEFGYSSQNPDIEATEGYHNLSRGFGLRLQEHSRPPDMRYRYTSEVDCSIAGQVILAPWITGPVTPGTVDSTNGISGFYELGGTLYAVNGRYIQYRANDTTFTVSKDLGAAKVALDAIVARQTGSATTYALIAMGDADNFWYHDGASTTTTWTQHASLKALAWMKDSTRIYRAHTTNGVAFCLLSADFITAGNWSASLVWLLGDYQYPTVKLTQNALGTLVGLKQDGIHVLRADGTSEQLYPGFRFTPGAENGKYPFLFGNHLHTTYSGSHVRIDPGMGLEAIGPERFTGNDSTVSGYITAGCGTPFRAYAGLFNPDTQDSHLMCFGGYDTDENGVTFPLDVWHGALSKVDDSTGTFVNRKITAMHRSTIGAPTGHERMWIGCSDGTIFHFILPCTANPLGCTAVTYNDGALSRTGYVFLPYWHGGYSKDEKVIRAGTSIVTKSLASTYGFSGFSARTAGGPSYTNYSWPASLAGVPGGRLVIGRTTTLGDHRLAIVATGGAAATTDTPVLAGFALHYRTNPERQLTYELNVICEDGLTRRDGSRYDPDAGTIRSRLSSLYATTAGAIVALPDETGYDTTGVSAGITVQLSGWQERTVWNDKDNRWASVITVRATVSDPGNAGLHASS